jgi:hypothetical protein
LDAREAERIWAEGQTISLEDALSEALNAAKKPAAGGRVADA